MDRLHDTESSKNPPEIKPGRRPFHGTSDPRPGSKGFYNKSPKAILLAKGKLITKKAIEMALAGDVVLLKCCLERLLPPARVDVDELELRLARLEAATKNESLH
jgi:hypothetical protein